MEIKLIRYIFVCFLILFIIFFGCHPIDIDYDEFYPEINVREGEDDINSGSGCYNFITRPLGTSIPTAYFFIENTGTGFLKLTGNPKISINGTNASEFSVDYSGVDTIIPARENDTFEIFFKPLSVGDKIATISINNSDSDENPYIFTVKGKVE